MVVHSHCQSYCTGRSLSLSNLTIPMVVHSHCQLLHWSFIVIVNLGYSDWSFIYIVNSEYSNGCSLLFSTVTISMVVRCCCCQSWLFDIYIVNSEYSNGRSFSLSTIALVVHCHCQRYCTGRSFSLSTLLHWSFIVIVDYSNGRCIYDTIW